MHQSIATIHAPEFINLQPMDINPLMSSCEIKVLYVGANRNRSYMTKEVITEMAKTLRGAPIVGYYKKDKGDFADHGDMVIIDDEGIRFECLTKPYGFVAPDAKVWFQKFEDIDDFGNSIIREYLMTTGYLWTGQFEECQVALEGEGNPHSMELDKDTLDGHWSENIKEDMEFFIVNDAIFSKLCILGEDVEPCFEGSSIKRPEISASFSRVDEEFTQTLYSMMQDLHFALKGEQKMLDGLENEVVDTSVVSEETPTDTSFAKEENKKEEEKQDKTEKTTTDKKEESTDDEDKKKEDKFVEKKDDDEDVDDKKEDKDDEDEQKKYTALQEQYSALESKYSELESKYSDLLEFKLEVERKEKEDLIKSFYMLDDEDKVDVKTNIDKYSLDDIEAKLSVICVRKKVNFDLEDDSKQDEIKDDVTTYNLNDNIDSSIPAWVRAVKENE